MKLISLSMVRNEEYWIWYSLTSVAEHVDEMLVFDNHSDDRTVEIVRGLAARFEHLTLFENFGGASEQENRERILQEARARQASHVLLLDGDEVHNDDSLGFCRRLLELAEHEPPLSDPPRHHGRPRDIEPTDGILLKNIGFKPFHPGYAGPDTCRPGDLEEPDTSHGCYNFAIRIVSLANLRGNGLDWGQHGYLETGDLYIQASPHTLWLPGASYHHFTLHPRSSKRVEGDDHWSHGVQDAGSAHLPDEVTVPEVLFAPDGPGNPTLEGWGMRAPAPFGSLDPCL